MATNDTGIRVARTIAEALPGGGFLVLDMETGDVNEVPAAAAVLALLRRQDRAAVRRGVSTVRELEWRNVPAGFVPPE